jgi:hypothetical protein
MKWPMSPTSHWRGRFRYSSSLQATAITRKPSLFIPVLRPIVRADLVGQRDDKVADPGGTACREHFFNGSLADQQVAAVEHLLDDDRHSPPIEVEGDLVTLEIPVGELLRSDQVLVLEHRLVEQVLQPGLEIAV